MLTISTLLSLAAWGVALAVLWGLFLADTPPMSKGPTKTKPVPIKPPGTPKPPAPWQDAPPLFELPGPFGETNTVNLRDEGLEDWLGGAFSFMATLRMDDLNEWSRVFDFCTGPDFDMIGAGAIEYGFDLHFTISIGAVQRSISVPDFFILGREMTVLFTVSSTGHMQVYQDGELFAESAEGEGQVGSYLERPYLIVAGHHAYPQGFRGELKDIKVWNQEVTWPEQS